MLVWFQPFTHFYLSGSLHQLTFIASISRQDIINFDVNMQFQLNFVVKYYKFKVYYKFAFYVQLYSADDAKIVDFIL